MIDKFINSTTVLILGIILLFVAIILPSPYDDARNSGYEIDATVVEIVEHKHPAIEEYEVDTYTYTIYASYTADGKTYEHVEIEERETHNLNLGDTVKIVVNPENPKEILTNNNSLGVSALIIIVIALFVKIIKIICRFKKSRKTGLEAKTN